MLSPGESYLKVGCVYWGMTAKFRVGDKVRIVRDWPKDDIYYDDEYNEDIKQLIGHDYVITDSDEGYYRLRGTYWYIPESMLELVQVVPSVGQYSITLKMVDGTCVSGSMGITRKEFEELWERFIAGRVR